MSVIAKLSVREFKNFGTGSFIALGCVASNEVMAAYAGSEEDKLFSRYSPSGDVRLHQSGGWAVFTDPQADYVERDPAKPWQPPMFYAMLISLDETPEPKFGERVSYTQVECFGVSKYAYDGSRVELRDVRGWRVEPAGGFHDWGSVIEKLSWTMHVDNPPAERQFAPGRKYWVAFYPTDQYDRDQAIAKAHGG